MKKWFTFLFLYSSFFALSQNTLKPFEVTEFTLDNGLTVMLSENHDTSKIFGVVAVKAGGKNDPSDATGIAHYLEHVLFKGTNELGTTDYEKEKVFLDSISMLYDELGNTKVDIERSKIQKKINDLSLKAAEFAIPNELDLLISGMGGTDVNAFTTEDYTAYFNNFPANQLEKWLDLYSHRFQNPVFRLFQSELETVYEEKNISMDDTFGVLFESVLESVYKKHPYGQQTILGKVSHLKNPSLKKMYEFFKTYYVANNMVLALSGDFDTQTVIPLIKSKFKNWHSGDIPKFADYNEESFNKREFKQDKLTPIKLGCLAFRSPNTTNEDAVVYNMALQTLYNDEETGFLDKITDEGLVMEAGLVEVPYNDYGATIFYFIPKLIGQKLETAENIVLEQIKQLKSGAFSDAYVEALKKNKIKEIALRWENNEERTLEMVNAFTQSKNWNNYIKKYEKINTVTKEDLMDLGNTYFNENYLCFYSRMGKPDKEKLVKPNFESVVSNQDTKSIYAQNFERIEVTPMSPNFVDFNSAVTEIKLDHNFIIKKTGNPFNDVFDLSIAFGAGNYKIPELMALQSYLGLIGTDTLSVTELKQAFHSLGASYYFSVTDHEFKFHVSGLESELEAVLKLCQNMLSNFKFDEDKVKQVVDLFKTQKKINREDTMYLLQNLNQFVMLGDQAPIQRELTKKEIKTLNAETLHSAFNQLKDYEITVRYTGNTNDDVLTELCKSYLNTNNPKQPRDNPYVFKRAIPESTKIYILDHKDAVQSQIGFNIECSPRNNDHITDIKLFNTYFGDGMSSLVFQEIREFRSLAYATFANYELAPYENYNNRFIGYVGCQADKTIDAIEAMSELIYNMPQKKDRISNLKSAVLEGSKVAKPNFRNLIVTLETWKQAGFIKDPNAVYNNQISQKTFDDIVSFYESEIQNKPMVITMVTDLSRVDLEALKQFGEVTIIKEKRLFVN